MFLMKVRKWSGREHASLVLISHRLPTFHVRLFDLPGRLNYPLAFSASQNPYAVGSRNLTFG
jgi:hypothetical protein